MGFSDILTHNYLTVYRNRRENLIRFSLPFPLVVTYEAIRLRGILLLKMSDSSFYFKRKYRIPSTRLKNWDYSSSGWYFVTICTYQKKNYFGEIINRRIILTKIGKIAKKYWLEIPNHFPNTKIDEYVVMPNHIHGIVVIVNSVETQNFASLQNRFGPQSKNLASIIRGFKTAVKKYAVINNIPFFWQSRFYDHIIRNEKSLQKIREYIRFNPLNWDSDEENPKNIKF